MSYAKYSGLVAGGGGGGGGGITSINGDTNAAQTIAAGTGITVGTSSGTTTITATGGGSGITSINGDTTAAQVIAAGTGITVNSVSGTTTITASGGGGGATVTLNNLTSPTSINQSLTLATGDKFVGYASDGANTTANLLTIQGQSKTGFDQNGGNILLTVGGATGAVASEPGSILFETGGGAYSSAVNRMKWVGLISTGPGRRGTIISNGSIEINNGGSGLSQNSDEMSLVVNNTIPIVFTPTEIETQPSVDFTNNDGSGSIGVTVARHNRMQPFKYCGVSMVTMGYSFGDAIPTFANETITTKSGTLNVDATQTLLTGALGVGNSASATIPGTVVKKIEVFDASGASLGFIAVYNTIT